MAAWPGLGRRRDLGPVDAVTLDMLTKSSMVGIVITRMEGLCPNFKTISSAGYLIEA